jgi:hypothetical protein
MKGGENRDSSEHLLIIKSRGNGSLGFITAARRSREWFLGGEAGDPLRWPVYHQEKRRKAVLLKTIRFLIIPFN